MRARESRSESVGPAGFLVVDKPAGWTSHDVVDQARRWLGTRRVGHLGTLDPLATGVLPLAVREATKLVPFLAAGIKHYVGTIRLGRETDTLDAEGQVVRDHVGPLPDTAAVHAALAALTGDLEQIPPMFSAVKHHGVPLYRLARRGEQVARTPRRIRVECFRGVRFASPDLEIEVICSPGTYVRVLAADLGQALGCGAHLLGLRRTRSGPFDVAQAKSVEVLAAAAERERGELEAHLVPAALPLGFPSLRLDLEEARQIVCGGDLRRPAAAPRFPPGTRVAALDARGTLFAVLEARADHSLRPLRVLREVADREPLC